MRAPAPVLAIALALLLAGCSGGDSGTGGATSDPTGSTGPASALRLASPDFADGGPMPRAYSCDANAQRQVSPPLNVTGIPEGAVSLALVMLDPDVPVPEAPAQVRVHWLVWNVTPADGEVRFPQGAVPPGAREGTGDGGFGYSGPCPPPASSPHRYNFTVYALDAAIQLESGSTRAELGAAMEGHVLAAARLVGTYVRQVV